MNSVKKLLFGTWGKDAGLFVLRLLTGLYMAFGHGWGKITGGSGEWEKLGGAVAVFGIQFLPTLWGFLAAFSEFVCSLLVSIGLFTRAAAFLMLCTMGVAAGTHLAKGDGWVGHGSAELALGYAIAFLAILLMGGGSFSLDRIVMTGDNE